MSSKSKLRNDIILATVILLIALICFLIFFFTMKEGEKVKILSNNKELYVFSLDDEIKQEIVSKNGVNTVEIKDGKVRVISADCPDKICVEHKSISKVGETIVCLPHRLVVEIVDEG